MSDAVRTRVLFTAAILSVALAAMLGVLIYEFTESTVPGVDIWLRSTIAAVLAGVMLSRKRWSGVPLALYNGNVLRYYVAGLDAEGLNAHGRTVMITCITLEAVCIVTVLVLRPKRALPPSQSSASDA